MIKAVLFDIDGTIMNTEKVMKKSLQNALKEKLELSIAQNELDFIFSLTSENTIATFTPIKSKQKEILEKWHDNVKALIHEANVFDEVEQVLEFLHKNNYPLGVVTSKNADELAFEFKHLELSNYFDVIVTSSDTTEPKPSPQPLIKAMKHLKTIPEETIYIGDSVNDMKSAYSSGVHFALAEWGAKDDREFDGVEIKLQRPNHLITLLEEAF